MLPIGHCCPLVTVAHWSLLPIGLTHCISYTLYDSKKNYKDTNLPAYFLSILITHFKGELDNETVSMAKMYVTEKFAQRTSDMLQLWGGWGYMWEYPIAKSFAGARVTTIYAGTSEIMRELISRGIYGR